MILEDFNTTGLNENKKKDFFFKDNIRDHSHSKTQSGGSHGIGKIVFNVASDINTFFAFSITENEKFFKGKAVFPTHHLNEENYRPYGILNLCENKDKPFIDKLFKRQSDQKGLSIAIPFVSEDIDINKLMSVIIRRILLPYH